MKMSLDNSPYLDRSTGLPVEGRLRIYVHGTDILATVYSLEGSDYVEAANPCLLHGGYPELSLFAELGLIDIHVDRYIGEEGAMSVESPDSDFAQIDVFEYGLDYDISGATATTVDTLDALRSANTELGMVTVKWYSGPGDCVPRNYVWDPDATNEEDGGYVVASSTSDSGRWILAWEDEVLPCTAYGVTAGNESNINLFLNYPRFVGSFSLVTAPRVRFVPGEYTTTTTLATPKEVCFDAGARFGSASFSCPRIFVFGQPTSYIADFSFTGNGAVAHSAWFRTIDRFWHSGATVLCVDALNYFTDARLLTWADLGSKVVTGAGTRVSSYVNGSFFRLDGDSEIPDGFFGKDDYVTLLTDRGDAVFSDFAAWDPGLVTAGHHQYYMQKPSLGKFKNADRWLGVMLERRARLTQQQWNDYELDLQGRTVSTFSLPAGSFTTVKNGAVSGAINVGSSTLVLRNMQASLHILAGAGAGVIGYGSRLTFIDSTGLSEAQLDGCDTTVLGSAGWDPATVTVAVNGGSFDGVIKLSDAHAEAMALHGAVSFNGVRIAQHGWRLNRIDMRGCECAAKIDLMPASGGDTYWYWTATLAGNRFTGNARVWFGACFASGSSHNELDGRVRLNWVRIVGNDFGGTDGYGVKMIKYNPVTYNVLVSADTGIWEYRGNTGRCPRLSVGAVPCGASWSAVQSGANLWKVHSDTWNVFCPYNNYGDGSYHLAQDGSGTGVSNVQVPYALWTNLIGGEPESYAYAYGGIGIDTASVNDEDVNDLFLVKLAVGAGAPGVAPPALDSGNVWFPCPGVV